ncbi:hypothetical protein [Roseovarius sp. Pro17]|uniref:hypothetical protein n=1 Tax=Roseovarius sp. Pro17 TaxID=3108175 RepID=UPI002D780B82|nr:hypothetical protein [Roseovarius sp. Pro17]
MELLVAMFSGAVGAVCARRAMRRRAPGIWITTLLGILGGAGAWWVLAMIGPGEQAGPLLLWHLAAGAIGGGALVSVAIMLWARLVR